ncbi:unnamed protein product [Schistosoma mattheei]|uniref:Uncharacterized protein n=1 Tax=Schistosoma mattheei TaxID=31246 RepID=A0A183PWG3_9TREM|nr:unnamed protein product [Schistosoma mattheei]
MIEVIKFWKQKLEIKGVMIMNSSNLLEEMVPGIRKILNTDTDDEFIWFADEPKIDAMVNMEQKVCLHTLTINIRVPTRSDDIDSQIRQGNLILYWNNFIFCNINSFGIVYLNLPVHI